MTQPEQTKQQEERPAGRVGTGRRRVAVLAVLGVVVGMVAGYELGQVGDMPSGCDQVLSDSDAATLLRTQQSVSADPALTGDDPLTCRWTTAGAPQDETKRSVTLTVTVGRHRLFGAGGAVDTARQQARLRHARATPARIADDAVVTSSADASGAEAYVGVRDGRFSVLVSYRTSDADAAMAANLAELAASSVLPGGPKP